MPWHLCDVAHKELLQVAELVEKAWQEVDRGATLRQSHTMLEHCSDLVLTKKMVPPYIYSTTRLGQQLYFQSNLDQKGGGVDGR